MRTIFLGLLCLCLQGCIIPPTPKIGLEDTSVLSGIWVGKADDETVYDLDVKATFLDDETYQVEGLMKSEGNEPLYLSGEVRTSSHKFVRPQTTLAPPDQTFIGKVTDEAGNIVASICLEDVKTTVLSYEGKKREAYVGYLGERVRIDQEVPNVRRYYACLSDNPEQDFLVIERP